MATWMRWLGMVSMALLFGGAAHAQMRVLTDVNSSTRQQRLTALVQTRLTSISDAFPTLLERTNVEMHVVIQKPRKGEDPPLARYDAVLDTLIFQRAVLGYVYDDVTSTMSDYWAYYEHEEVHCDYPIVEVIDDVLWKALFAEFAQQNALTWPPSGCHSTDLPQRLGCQMMVSGIESLLHSRRMRIFNENRLDRLWPSDLSELESRGWERGDRQYQEVRELGGIELIKPLVQEFGAPRVFAYVAQTPFVVRENDLFKSATQYQQRARQVLAW
jgi:hypothetical protein